MLAACLLLSLPCIVTAQQPEFASIVQAADAARAGHDLPRAIELYRQAVQLDSQYADGWWFLGFLQYGRDEYPAAREALTHFIELKPNAAPALALRGLCEYETAAYAQALADIEQGIALGAANQPRNEYILRLHEGLLLTREAKFERALQAYLPLASQTSGPGAAPSAALTLGLGMAGLRMAALPQQVSAPQQDIAMAAGQAALELTSAPSRADEGPGSPANTGAGTNTAPDAVTVPPGAKASGAVTSRDEGFQALFARYPNTPNAHYFYGYLLFATDPERAASEFQQELKVNPRNAPAQAMLAWAALMHSDPDGALAPASAAVSEDANLPLGQLVLGRALLETGSVAAGTGHLQQAQRLEPDNLETHLALARAYSTSNHPEDARRERTLCLQLTDTHAPAP